MPSTSSKPLTRPSSPPPSRQDPQKEPHQTHDHAPTTRVFTRAGRSRSRMHSESRSPGATAAGRGGAAGLREGFGGFSGNRYDGYDHSYGDAQIAVALAATAAFASVGTGLGTFVPAEGQGPRNGKGKGKETQPEAETNVETESTSGSFSSRATSRSARSVSKKTGLGMSSRSKAKKSKSKSDSTSKSKSRSRMKTRAHTKQRTQTPPRKKIAIVLKEGTGLYVPPPRGTFRSSRARFLRAEMPDAGVRGWEAAMAVAGGGEGWARLMGVEETAVSSLPSLYSGALPALKPQPSESPQVLQLDSTTPSDPVTIMTSMPKATSTSTSTDSAPVAHPNAQQSAQLAGYAHALRPAPVVLGIAEFDLFSAARGRAAAIDERDAILRMGPDPGAGGELSGVGAVSGWARSPAAPPPPRVRRWLKQALERREGRSEIGTVEEVAG